MTDLLNTTIYGRIERALLEGRIEFWEQIVVLLRGDEIANPPHKYELLARLIERDAQGHEAVVPAQEWIDDLRRFPVLLRRVDRLGLLQALQRQQRVCGVNLSAETLNDFAFLSWIAEHLRDEAIDRERLYFEVTEATALQPASFAALQQIRGFGYRWVGLDDFGKRENGFDALEAVEPRFLKIDMHYVVNLKTSRTARAIVRAILLLAHDLELVCVAEGVETIEIRDALLEQHDRIAPDVVLYGQGWLYGKAEPCGGVA